MLYVFDTFLVIHVVAGTTGLVAFWPPLAARKGGKVHTSWGKAFAYGILIAGTAATGMSLCTLIAPMETHPRLSDREMIVSFFGWMMLFLSLFTMSLAWYGLECVWLKQDHRKHRNPMTLGLVGAVFVSALACIARGWAVGQPLIAGVGVLGLITVGFFVRFIWSDAPGRIEWLVQHMRALVGAGVSVYTAFFSFGAANLMPQIAFNPVLWAAPTVVGIGVIVYHETRLRKPRRRAATPSAGTPAL